MARKFGFTHWSWRRASGLSAAKGKLSRFIGIPLTQAGRQKKLGRLLGALLWPFSFLGSRARSSPTFESQGGAGCIVSVVSAAIVVVGLPALCCGMVGYRLSLLPPAAERATVPLPAQRAAPEAQEPQRSSTNPGPALPVVKSSQGRVLEVLEPVESEPLESPPEVRPPKPVHEQRTWTSANGTFKREATFVRYSNGKVHLRKADGEEIALDESKLSEADRGYLEDLHTNVLMRPQ